MGLGTRGPRGPPSHAAYARNAAICALVRARHGLRYDVWLLVWMATGSLVCFDRCLGSSPGTYILVAAPPQNSGAARPHRLQAMKVRPNRSRGAHHEPRHAVESTWASHYGACLFWPVPWLGQVSPTGSSTYSVPKVDVDLQRPCHAWAGLLDGIRWSAGGSSPYVDETRLDTSKHRLGSCLGGHSVVAPQAE